MRKHEIGYQDNFDPHHCNRSYRRSLKSSDLVSFQVKEKESDLLIQAPIILQEEARSSLKHLRKILEDYIQKNPIFKITLKPYPMDIFSDPMIREMIEVSSLCQVGPMAAVAGCISQYVAKSLLNKTSEVIIENGGDLYIKSPRIRKVIIYAGLSPLSNKIYLKIGSRQKGIGVCTSSGTVGPSFSMGKADAVTVLSPSAAMADAAATAIGNVIQTTDDIKKGIDLARNFSTVQGVVIIKDDKIGLWGEIDYGFI